MKILFSLSYYTPYVSGVTIYARRLAEALANRGHRVAVLTSQHKSSLKRAKTVAGVKIKRVPVLLKFGKGNLMPLWLIEGWHQLKKHDLVLFHLPQVEAVPLAFLAKVLGKKVFATYHCDVILPKSFLNFFQEKGVFLANFFTCLMAKEIVSYTTDYGLTSPLLRLFKKKLVFILPPVMVEKAGKKEKELIRKKISKKKTEILIGFAGRMAAEKGIEYLFAATPLLLKKGFRPKIVVAGPGEEVVGELGYVKKLKRLSQKYRDRIVFLGNLNQKEMTAFYSQIDILVLPSLNRTESFGLVQVEAMLFGTPVIASNLRGVRMPVRLTGMGEVVPLANAQTLAEAIIKISENESKYKRPKKEIKNIFNFQKTISAYERLFQKR